MSPQSLLHGKPSSAWKKLFLALSLVTLIVVLASCKPSAAPVASSPLQVPGAPLVTQMVPQTPLPADIAHKLTPKVMIITTPVSPFFHPEPHSTPAGSGVIGHMLPLFFVHQINVTNVWYEDTAGGTLRTYVFAGSKPAPGGESTSQGLILVQVAKMSVQGDISVVYDKDLLTPTQAGSVQILDARSERLILQSTNGTTFFFDVPSLQFAPSLTAVMPTLTPSPVSPLATPASQ